MVSPDAGMVAPPTVISEQTFPTRRKCMFPDHPAPSMAITRAPVSASGPATQPVLPVPVAFTHLIHPFTSVVASVCNHVEPGAAVTTPSGLPVPDR